MPNAPRLLTVNAAALQVGQVQLVGAGPLDQGLAVAGDLADVLLVHVLDKRGDQAVRDGDRQTEVIASASLIALPARLAGHERELLQAVRLLSR